MGGFVFLAVLLALIALAFALSALWQRSRVLALILALVVPLAAGGLYLLKGEPAALDPANLAAPKTVEEAVAQLERRLEAEPKTFENEMVLARSYMAAERFVEARNAYASALKLKPEETAYLAEYVEAMLRASSDHQIPAEAVPLLERAVATNPQDQRALFFLGMLHFQSSRPAQAAATWEKLLPLLDPPAAAALRQKVNEARAQSGQAPLDEPKALVQVEIGIEARLAEEAKPGDVIFVFARAPGGKGPPLAAKRLVVDGFPLVVGLGDEDSPMPAAKLSSVGQVEIMARLSHSGDVAPASGDLEAEPVQADTGGDAKVSLILNRKRP